MVLPFTKDEREFPNRILDYGEIDPCLLTSNKDMGTPIRNHPGLQWKALNVRELTGLKES
jgi:hypothetical protein